MALETGNYIGALVSANPTGADPKSQGDNHLRLIKQTLLNSFAGFQGAVMVTGADGGAANAYTVTPTNPVPSYSSRMIVAFSPIAQNTGACTIKVSDLAVVDLVDVEGAALVNADLIPGAVYAAAYDGTRFRLLSVTKNYVNQRSFSAALPAQAGNDFKFLRTRGGAAEWFTTGIRREARSVNTVITSDDDKKLVEYMAGGFVQTFASNLYNAFSVYLRNGSSAPVEVEAPAAVATTSATINTAAIGTTWVVGTGLAIATGDLVTVRRTAQMYSQRVVGTVTSYNASTGDLVVSPGYFVNTNTTAPVAIASMTAVGTTVTVTTTGPHNMVTNNAVVVTGSTPTAYNGTFVITVTGPTTFTYTAASAPGASASPVGTYTVRYTDWTITTRAPTAGIDNLAAYVMYPNEARLFTWDGTKLTSILVTPFYYVVAASETLITPPGYQEVEVDLVGGGGGGASGQRNAVGAASTGGCPGGSPGRVIRRVRSQAPGTATLTIIGVGGVGGAALLTDSAISNAGTAGGNTSYGTIVTAYGGAAGFSNSTQPIAVSGSGSLSAGSATSGAANGGGPTIAGVFGVTTGTLANTNNIYDGGGASSTSLLGNGGSTMFGGASIAVVNTSQETYTAAGGSSMNGVPGSSQGGWLTTSNTFPAKAPDAGARNSYTAGGGAIGGTCGATPTNGGDGLPASSISDVGSSGAGGGSSITAAAGRGGDGGYPGGAGGGGGASRSGFASGRGGNGAAGRAVIKGVA